jgi:hypothetical protein
VWAFILVHTTISTLRHGLVADRDLFCKTIIVVTSFGFGAFCDTTLDASGNKPLALLRSVLIKALRRHPLAPEA